MLAKAIIMSDDMARHFDLRIMVYSIPICLFFYSKKKKGSMCGKYGNSNLQVPLCPFSNTMLLTFMKFFT